MVTTFSVGDLAVEFVEIHFCTADGPLRTAVIKLVEASVLNSTCLICSLACCSRVQATTACTCSSEFSGVVSDFATAS